MLKYTKDIAHGAVVNPLLEKGANLEMKDSFGWISRVYPADKRQERVVKLLREKSAKMLSTNSLYNAT